MEFSWSNFPLNQAIFHDTQTTSAAAQRGNLAPGASKPQKETVVEMWCSFPLDAHLPPQRENRRRESSLRDPDWMPLVMTNSLP